MDQRAAHSRPGAADRTLSPVHRGLCTACRGLCPASGRLQSGAAQHWTCCRAWWGSTRGGAPSMASCWCDRPIAWRWTSCSRQLRRRSTKFGDCSTRHGLERSW